MPITAEVVGTAILAADPSLAGPVWTEFVLALGRAIQIWAVTPGNVVLQGTVTGAAGGGVVIGKFYLNPVPLPMPPNTAAVGLLGFQTSALALAVGLGVGNSMNATAMYKGVAAGAVGADISKVVSANPATLSALIVGSLAGQNIKGPLVVQLAMGLANGISTMVLTGGGSGVAAGPAGPAPSVGTSTSSLL